MDVRPKRHVSRWLLARHVAARRRLRVPDDRARVRLPRLLDRIPLLRGPGGNAESAIRHAPRQLGMVGSMTLPTKSTAFVCKSRTKKKNGRFTFTVFDSDGALNGMPMTAVEAAASVPFSSTRRRSSPARDEGRRACSDDGAGGRKNSWPASTVRVGHAFRRTRDAQGSRVNSHG